MPGVEETIYRLDVLPDKKHRIHCQSYQCQFAQISQYIFCGTMEEAFAYEYTKMDYNMSSKYNRHVVSLAKISAFTKQAEEGEPVFYLVLTRMLWALMMTKFFPSSCNIIQLAVKT